MFKKIIFLMLPAFMLLLSFSCTNPTIDSSALEESLESDNSQQEPTIEFYQEVSDTAFFQVVRQADGVLRVDCQLNYIQDEQLIPLFIEISNQDTLIEKYNVLNQGMSKSMMFEIPSKLLELDNEWTESNEGDDSEDSIGTVEDDTAGDTKSICTPSWLKNQLIDRAGSSDAYVQSTYNRTCTVHRKAYGQKIIVVADSTSAASVKGYYWKNRWPNKGAWRYIDGSGFTLSASYMRIATYSRWDKFDIKYVITADKSTAQCHAIMGYNNDKPSSDDDSNPSGPDLTVSSLTIKNSNGSKIINYKIKNIGNQTVSYVQVKLGWYDTANGGNKSSTFTISGSFPPNHEVSYSASYGEKITRGYVQVDPNNNVKEINEANNRRDW